MKNFIWGKIVFDLSFHQAPKKRLAGGSYQKLFFAIIFLLLLCSKAAIAKNIKQQEIIHFDIPQQRADLSLTQFAEQANLTLIFPYEVVQERKTNRLAGSYTVVVAVEKLLAGTGLRPVFSEQGLLTNITDKASVSEGNQMIKNKRGILAGIAALFLSAGSNAQENSDAANVTQLEELVVTGIRRSLQSAADNKRESRVIVDSIVAEDIGQFPDTNVAESLQRIPGVAIDRSGGEGQRVTVRGFGPDFNTVLVNGRRSASPSNPALGGGLGLDQIGQTLSSRGFNFDVISAELIGGADVFKTSSVALQEGGIGSTINLKTLRPLDLADNKILISAKGTYEELAEETSPSFFAFASGQFADGTVGLLGSISYQDRSSTRELASSNGYTRQVVADGDTSGFANAVGNVPGTYFQAQNVDLISDVQERERIGFTGTLQIRPNDQLELTFDALVSTYDVTSTGAQLGQFYVPNNTVNAVIDSNNTLTSFGNANRVNAYVGQGIERPSELKSFGFNAAWEPSNNLGVSLDISSSEAKDESADDGGRGYFVVIRDTGALLSFDNQNTIIPEIDSSTGYGSDFNALSSHFSSRFGDGVEDEIFESKLDIAWMPENTGVLSEVRGGILVSTEDRSNKTVRSPNGCFNCGDRTPVPGSFASFFSLDGFLGNSGLSGLPGTIVQQNGLDVINYLESSEGLAARDANLGLPVGTSAGLSPGYTGVLQPAQSYDVSEDIVALYGELQFDGEIADKTWTINAGFRYVETDASSSGSDVELLDLLPIPNDPTEVAGVFSPEVVPVAGSTSYSHTLPSINARIDLQDDLIFRAAYSQTLTRPPISFLAPSFAFPSQIRPSLLTASAGNPSLEPFESDNIDLALEWYYGEGSYASLGYFKKDVDGFIVSQVGQEVLRIANSQNITDVPLINGDQATFNVARPQNLEKASVDGVEISWQHTFASGFGIQANAILVDSNAEIDVNNTTQSFALNGLGDSSNLVVFYENDRFTGRLAYNIRDKFLRSASTGPSGEPAFVNEFKQMDFRLSYNVTDSTQVFFDGINILDEEISQHGRFENHFLLVEETGARYSLGVRATF